MEVETGIELLKTFRAELIAWARSNDNQELRASLRKKLPAVRRIVTELGVGKILTIVPPAMVGGPVMSVDPLTDPFGAAFDAPFHKVAIGVIDEALGALEHGVLPATSAVTAPEAAQVQDTTRLVSMASDLVLGNAYSLDAVLSDLWRHGEPAAVPNPFPVLAAVMQPFSATVRSLWSKQDPQHLAIIAYTDALTSVMRALEYFLDGLRAGIRAVTVWSPLWLKTFEQFRDRYNRWLDDCERHFNQVIPQRVPAFERLGDAQTLRHGGPTAILAGGTFAAEMFLATETIRRILETAKTDVLIVDNYTDADTLALLYTVGQGVTARVLTANMRADYAAMGRRYRGERGNGALETRESNSIHDRYILIDDSVCYHIGASLKDLGKKVFSFSRKDEPTEAAKLIATLRAAWAAAVVVVM